MTEPDNLIQTIETYYSFCKSRKNLDKKTIKSYSIDLNQYVKFITQNHLIWHKKDTLELYIDQLHKVYKPKSVKRKTAS